MVTEVFHHHQEQFPQVRSPAHTHTDTVHLTSHLQLKFHCSKYLHPSHSRATDLMVFIDVRTSAARERAVVIANSWECLGL